MKGPEFLDKKYPDLTGSKPVERAVQHIKRKGKKAPNERSARIEAYIERISDIAVTKRRVGTGFDLLKQKILEKYTTKQEEIPESYWNLQEKIMRERGEGGDWANASDKHKNELKKQNSEGVLADQKSSLEQWVNYFGSEDSDYISKELKYWIFRNVLGLQEYDKQKKEFPKRSKGTINQFPDINYEALAYVVDVVIEKLQGGNIEFEHDIQQNEREEFRKFLEKEDFAKLYAWANDLMNPIPEHLLPVTDGKWRKYGQNSDSFLLVQTIRGKGTGWCTAGENTARTQLGSGDFYVFYSLDDDKKPTIPRIAIRMQGDKIAEVRGVAYKQNLDPYMSNVLAKKLEEFPDKKEYIKKDTDMKMLTSIENKIKMGQELNRDELVFLYEVNSKIRGFGYQADPRIKELRKNRNLQEDLPVVFECNNEQIAYKKEDLNENTKAYIGVWTPEVLKLLPESVTYVYEQFPEKKVFLKTLETDPKIQSADDVEKAILAKGQYLSSYVENNMLEETLFSKEAKKYELVSFSVSQLGFPSGATLGEIYAKAKKFGLELCPAEVGPQLRLQYENQPEDEYLRIAMDSIFDSDGDSGLFRVVRDDGESWLDSSDGHLDLRWFGDNTFVFLRRKSS